MCFTTLLALNTYHLANAQTSYQAGFYVTNSGDTVRAELLTSPNYSLAKTLTWRQPGATASQSLGLDDVLAFQLDGSLLHERHAVEVNKSPIQERNIEPYRKPRLVTDTVWLTRFVDGPFCLLGFYEGSRPYFYYRRPNETQLRSLLYHVYRDETPLSNTASAQSNRQQVIELQIFAQELQFAMTCNARHENYYQQLGYFEQTLVKHFQAENKCLGATSIKVDRPRQFEVWAQGSAGYHSLYRSAPRKPYNETVLATNIAYGFGAQLRYLPQIGVKGLSFGVELDLLFLKETSRDTVFNADFNINRARGNALLSVRYEPLKSTSIRPFVEGGLRFPFYSKTDTNFDIFNVAPNALTPYAAVGLRNNRVSVTVRTPYAQAIHKFGQRTYGITALDASIALRLL